LGTFDGYSMDPWFSQFMGGIRFKTYIPTFVTGTVTVEDKNHPAMQGAIDAARKGWLGQVYAFRATIDKPIPGVKYVKFWMLSPQVPDFHQTCPLGNFSGCSFTAGCFPGIAFTGSNFVA
jgi:hypothetical protein